MGGLDDHGNLLREGLKEFLWLRQGEFLGNFGEIFLIRDFFEMDSEIFWILKILVVVWRWLSMWWWSILPGRGGGGRAAHKTPVLLHHSGIKIELLP